MIFADKLIELRKKNGWSQEELAEKVISEENCEVGNVDLHSEKVKKFSSVHREENIKEILVEFALIDHVELIVEGRH